MKVKSFFASALILLAATACSKKDAQTELWVYTSSYKEVLALYDEALKKELPDIKVKWFQSGSENVASKVLAEMSAGETKADLMMTSDLFFYQELKKKGALHQVPADVVSALPTEMVDHDRNFVVTRFPVMVIAYNKDRLGDVPVPQSFKDLLKPVYKNKLSMPSPLESGTALTTVLFFKQMFGNEFFTGLRANEIIAQGGNGATMAKIQSGEKPVGVVLLENVLQAHERGNQSVNFLIPDEGALPMPSPLAIFKSTKHPKQAEKLFAWLLGKSGQDILLKGWNYSPYPEIPAPKGAPDWKDLKKQSWNLKQFEQWGEERQAVKDTFQKVVLQ